MSAANRDHDPHVKGRDDTPHRVNGGRRPALEFSHIHPVNVLVPVARLTRAEYAQHARTGPKLDFHVPNEVVEPLQILRCVYLRRRHRP